MNANELITFGQEFAPAGKHEIWTWEEFTQTFPTCPKMSILHVDSVSCENIRVPGEPNKLADQIFRKLNLPQPNLNIDAVRQWSFHLRQYDGHGKEIRPKKTTIWLLDRPKTGYSSPAILAYHQLTIIDKLHQLHFINPLNDFLPDTELFAETAALNKYVDENSEKSYQIPMIPSWLTLDADLFDSYYNFIPKMELLIDQFDSSEAKTTVTLIHEPAR